MKKIHLWKESPADWTNTNAEESKNATDVDDLRQILWSEANHELLDNDSSNGN